MPFGIDLKHKPRLLQVLKDRWMNQVKISIETEDPFSGDIFLFSWMHMWFMLSLIAINRYVAVCKFGKYDTTFTHKRTTISVAGSWILALVVWAVFIWMPCCRYKSED